MVKRISGVSKLSPEVRRKLAAMAAEARRLVYGELGYPEWGTSFAEMESDAQEVGHEFLRLVLEQTADDQSAALPESALTTAAGETARAAGREPRVLITESGEVCWNEPKAYLPQSRKAFFPSEPGVGAGG